MADDLSIFGGLPGNADEDRLRKARRRLQMRNNFVSEGPLPPRARPSGVGGSKLGPPPTPPPPVSFNTVAPAVTGTPQVGQTLTCSTGTWTNSPTSYSYAWRVGGVTQGTASTYVVQSGDVGSTIVCLVTARNAGGYSTPASSNTVGPVTAAPSGSTWSAADASANAMTLTNGGMTVSNPSVVNQSIRGTISKTSGKLYVEFLANQTAGTTGFTVGFGVASSGFNPGSYMGATQYSAGVYNGSTICTTGFTNNYSSSFVRHVGDVIGLAIDFSAGSIYIAYNNVWDNSSNPVTGTAPVISFVPATVGALFPTLTFQQLTGEQWTLQPTPASQKYLPPPGFQAWDGGPVTPMPLFIAAGSGDHTTGPAVTLNTTGADLLVAHQSGGLSVGVTDNKGNTWTRIGTSLMSYCRPTSVGSGHTISSTAGTSGSPSISVAAFSGSTSSPLDQSAFNGSGGTVGPITPTVANELIVTGVMSNAADAATPAGFTYLSDYPDGTDYASTMAFQTQTAPNATTATWGGTNLMRSSIASFKLALPPPALPTASTWSVIDASNRSLTLSNGNMTVQGTNVALQGIRNTISKSSGKLYVEFLLVAQPSPGNLFFGLSGNGYTTIYYPGFGSGSSIGVQPTFGALAQGGFTILSSSPTPSSVVNDVWSIAIDFGAQLVWYGRNGVWFNSGNPASGTGAIASFVFATTGPIFATVCPYPNTITLQASAASQKYLPPGGFQAWDGGPVTPVGTPPSDGSVWNTTDVATVNALVLSNSNSTIATGGSHLGWGTVRNTTSHSTGKLYVEFVCNTTATEVNWLLFGVASSGMDVTEPLGAAAFSGGIAPGTSVGIGNAVGSTGFTVNYYFAAPLPHAGDVWAMAVDFATGNMWFGVNNVWFNSSNPATGAAPYLTFVPATVGALFAAASLGNGHACGSYTIHPTATTQTYAPPSGFSPWG